MSEGRQGCSALHTPDSTGSWIRLSWACKSSRLATSYWGSERCSRTEEGGAHRKICTEVRGGTIAVDKSRKSQLKVTQPEETSWLYHATEHIKATVPDHSVQLVLHMLKAWKVRTAKSRRRAQPCLPFRRSIHWVRQQWWKWSPHLHLMQDICAQTVSFLCSRLAFVSCVLCPDLHVSMC